jgi:hypothetical protein
MNLLTLRSTALALGLSFAYAWLLVVLIGLVASITKPAWYVASFPNQTVKFFSGAISRIPLRCWLPRFW